MARRELTVVSYLHDTKTGIVRKWDDLTPAEQENAANKMQIAAAIALNPGCDITVRYKNRTIETYRDGLLLDRQGVN